MPSSSSVSPPDGGRSGAAEEGGGGGRVEEVEALGLSWALEPPTGAASDTHTNKTTTKQTLAKQWGAIFGCSICGIMMLDVRGHSHLLAPVSDRARAAGSVNKILYDWS